MYNNYYSLARVWAACVWPRAKSTPKISEKTWSHGVRKANYLYTPNSY